MAMMATAVALLPVRVLWDTKPASCSLARGVKSETTYPSFRRMEVEATTSKPTLSIKEVKGQKLKNPSSRARHNRMRKPREEKLEEAYLGYDRWLPVITPKVNRPQSIYNASTLAYLGDCIYEMYARRHFLYPPLSIDEYNGRVMAVVRCEAQDAVLKKIMEGDFLTEEERGILRWGRNAASSNTKSRKRAGVAVYSRASSLETLIGHLYLNDVNRLEDLMCKLGFSAGCSDERIVEKTKVEKQIEEISLHDAVEDGNTVHVKELA